MVGAGETIYIQFDGYKGDGNFDRGLFSCTLGCLPPTGSLANSLRAFKSMGTDVALRWPDATVSPANFAAYKTSLKTELDETATGIGDETLVMVTPLSGLTEPNTVPPPPPQLFYKVLPADRCDQPVFQ